MCSHHFVHLHLHPLASQTQVTASIPAEVGGDDDRMVQVLHDRLDAQEHQLTHDSALDELAAAFSRWFDDEKKNMNAGTNPLGESLMDDTVTKHCCYGRMCAVWDPKCSCGEGRTWVQKTQT